MSLSTLPLLLLTTLISAGQLNLTDIASLRLVSHTYNTTFTHPELCRFLLHHFFPFTPETNSPHPEAALAAVCRRLHRLRTGKWTLNWEVTFPTSPSSSIFPPDGFHLIDLNSDEGYFLTAYTDDPTSTQICVRNLLTAQDVSVSVPHQDLTGIYMRAGKTLLTYTRDTTTLLILTDCRTNSHGTTLWSASITSQIYHGVHPSTRHNRLEPVFNNHYIAFLNNPNGNLLILRFNTQQLHISPLRISPSTLLSFTADSAGSHLLVAERFAHYNNLHRVVLVDALSGASICAFHVNVSPQFQAFPERDLCPFFSPDGTRIVVWSSVRSAEYRAGILGQVMVVPVSGGGAKVRYFASAGEGVGETGYSVGLGTVGCDGVVMGYEGLNLEVGGAGSGEVVNGLNVRGVVWTAEGGEVGDSWVMRERKVGEEVVVEVMRIADGRGAPGVVEGSKRSSWVLASTGGSSGGSIIGVREVQVQVDAEELAMRLVEMEKEREGGRRKGWREKLLSVWR